MSKWRYLDAMHLNSRLLSTKQATNHIGNAFEGSLSTMKNRLSSITYVLQ